MTDPTELEVPFYKDTVEAVCVSVFAIVTLPFIALAMVLGYVWELGTYTFTEKRLLTLVSVVLLVLGWKLWFT